LSCFLYILVCADSGDLNQPAAGKGIAADTVDMDFRQGGSLHHEGRHHFFQADHGAAASRPAHYGSWPVIVLERQNREVGRCGRRFASVILSLGAALVVLGMLTAGNTLRSEPWEEKVQMRSSKIASVFAIHFAQLPVAGQRSKMGWGGVNPETGIQVRRFGGRRRL